MQKFVPGPVPMGNVVKDYYMGNTHIIICDDAYRNRSDEEQRKSWENVERIASEALRDKLIKEAMARSKEPV